MYCSCCHGNVDLSGPTAAVAMVTSLYLEVLYLTVLVPVLQACSTSMTDGPYTANCNSRGYTQIPQGIPTDINALNFKNNSLKVLKDRQLEAFESLHRLDLSMNLIHEIEKEAFSGIDHLITLELGNNKLKTIPYYVFHHLSNLVTLNINNNPLRTLQNSAFPYLSKLEYLTIEHCQLEYIAPRAFLGLSKLSQLKLAHNELKYLDSEVESSLGHSLRKIRLHGNPWQCDCHNTWLKRWLEMSDIEYHDKNDKVPFCTGPQRLARKYWPQIDIRDFACRPIITATQVVVEAIKGGDALMSCHIHADPKGDVRWYKDTTIVEYESLYTVHNAIGNDNNFTATLRIRNVTVNDTGNYFCEISNRAGQAEAEIKLVLMSPSAEDVWLNFWVIAGMGVASVLALILCGVLCFYCATSRKRKSENLAKVRQNDHYMKALPDDDEMGPICTVKIKQPLYTESVYRGKYVDDAAEDKRPYLSPEDWQRSLGYRNRTMAASPTSSDRTSTVDWRSPEPSVYTEYRRSPALAGPALMNAMTMESPSTKSSFRPDRPYSYYPELPSELNNIQENVNSAYTAARPMHFIYDRSGTPNTDDSYNVQAGTVV